MTVTMIIQLVVFCLFLAILPSCVSYASQDKWDKYLHRIAIANASYTGCGSSDEASSCYADVIADDLSAWRSRGIGKADIERAGATLATRYQVLNHKLYRNPRCVFPARCEGVEHFLLSILKDLPDMDIMINVYDHPQVPKYSQPSPVFSFSRDSHFSDIMYPAWTFWSGGPAVWPLYPTGLGRWDLQRDIITKRADATPWSEKESKAFFRGSRTSSERDPLILYSRKHPEFAAAAYTKNQAYRSKKDTLGEEPAEGVPLEDHCEYKYLFNFRGVAASFRFKHLFMCRSLVFQVGEEWLEFFYPALKPWVHYIPLDTDLKDFDEVLQFVREHDDVAQQIAERGYDFIWNNLQLSDVQAYWLQLLTDYAALLQYKPQLAEDMIEISP
eukprot:scpid85297/ scgid19107/ Protein O-glucosyltransferase 1; CAP10-like 46 kDa protein; KTEL motif-containing protein 1